MNKKSLVKEQVNYQEVGAQIPTELATKMVKDHYDQKTAENTHSYYVGKNIIEQMLAQPGCVGLRFIDALNESGNKTLVYIGVDAQGKTIREFTTVNEHGDIAVVEGMASDRALVDNPHVWFY